MVGTVRPTVQRVFQHEEKCEEKEKKTPFISTSSFLFYFFFHLILWGRGEEGSTPS